MDRHPAKAPPVANTEVGAVAGDQRFDHAILMAPHKAGELAWLAGTVTNGSDGWADVDEVTRWLTGFSQEQLDAHLASGTTLRDFIAPDGAPGYFEQELAAYGRGGEPCPRCGRPLKQAMIGQRASVWCGHCQR